MKFMIFVKATADSEAGVMPPENLLARMGEFHEEMSKAGILVDGAGLKPTDKGWRIRYEKGGKHTLAEGPFDSDDLVAGFTIIDVKSGDEALAWARRYPNPSNDGGAAEIEVRPFYELDDFGASRAVKRMKQNVKELAKH